MFYEIESGLLPPMSRNKAKPSSHSSGPLLKGLFEKQGILQNTPRSLAAHKCDIKRETRAIMDDTLKKVMVKFCARLKHVMDKKRSQINNWL